MFAMSGTSDIIASLMALDSSRNRSASMSAVDMTYSAFTPWRSMEFTPAMASSAESTLASGKTPLHAANEQNLQSMGHDPVLMPIWP